MELSCNKGVIPSLELLQPDQHFTVLLWWCVEGRGGWKPATFRRNDDEKGKAAIQVWPIVSILQARHLAKRP
jgi:hypothetical protein